MKYFYRGLIILAIILISGIIYFMISYAPLIAGYGAKDLCSCAYIGGQNQADVLKNELGRGFKALGTYKLNPEDSSATGSVFGFAKKKAIYRKGLGCTLLIDKSEIELRNELPSISFAEISLSDTLLWPFGNMTLPYDSDEVDMQKLTKAIDDSFINDDPKHPNNQRAVIVVYKGKIIAERHDPNFGPNTPQIGWSMSKSITNTMLGILVKKRGFDIYAPAPIPEWRDPNDPRSKITTDQLLRMSSGLEWEEDYGKVSHATKMLYGSEDMGFYASQLRLDFNPGEKWQYSSGTTNILSRILRIELGEDYLQWPFKEVFSKIGVNSALFEVDASNAFIGSSYIWASPRDWARLGLLYLNDGVWNGERILPEGWVDYTKTPTPPAEMQEYGAQFWLNVGSIEDPSVRTFPDCPRDVYYMDGYEGQAVYIIPSLEMVVVTMAQTDNGDFDFNGFLASVINSVN